MAIHFNIQESSNLKGVFVITPNVSTDLRGNIYTSFLSEQIDALLPNSANLKFKHDKFSHSHQNVLRGIHGDSKTYKLVTCVYGEILQVVVDCRTESLSYLQHEKFHIHYQNPKLILIPPNMGNAYFVHSKEAIYHYKLAYTGEYFDADAQFSLAFDDARIGIDWELNGATPILSNRDLKAFQTNQKEHLC